jgi:beta-lactamase superfamily II metal-dependent hydrolase
METRPLPARPLPVLKTLVERDQLATTMSLQLIIMDAGQGDATLIVYPDGSLTLIDCGCKKNKDVVKPQIGNILTHFLGKTNNRLKALVLTHPDGDHYNLVNDLVIQNNVTVDTIYYGGIASDYAGISSWLNKHNNAVYFAQGHSSTDVVKGLSYADNKANVDVRILAANAANPKIKTDANPNSIVLLVTYRKINIFLMGDSTSLTEIFLEMRLGTQIAELVNGCRSVLKAGHHGSDSSTTDAWLKRVQPQIAFISSDTKTFNGSSIPRANVIDRIRTQKLYDYGNNFEHKYVQYNPQTDRHEQVSTTLAIFTTLHWLEFAPNNTEFVAYGTSWYYDVDDEAATAIWPACGWKGINTAY